MKRGQLAMESVMVYGVVILIVMLAIGALIKFGVFDLSSLMPEKCDLKGQLQCEEYSVTAALVQLELKNNIGKNIEISKISIVGEDDTAGLWGEDEAAPDNCVITLTGAAQSLNNGAKTVYDLACTVIVDAGKKINGKIEVMYQTVGSDIQRTLIGDIRATVQP